MFSIEGTKDINVEVSEFRGQKRVDIRRWYEDKETKEMKRTNKGINMSLDEWDALKQIFGEIMAYIEDRR
ncbi:MAG: transcriptional coactivator p15/PC4 family protein [bacterium]